MLLSKENLRTNVLAFFGVLYLNKSTHGDARFADPGTNVDTMDCTGDLRMARVSAVLEVVLEVVREVSKRVCCASAEAMDLNTEPCGTSCA